MALTVRPLSTDDAPGIQSLLERSPGYTARVNGRPAAPGDGAALLESMPPVEPGPPVESAPPDTPTVDTTVFGLVDASERLLGLLHIATDWPEPGTAHVGLLLVDEEERGRGLGRLLHDSIAAQLRARPGIARLRAGIVGTNAEVAEPFWRRLGYRPTGERKPYREGDVTSSTAIWTRPLTQAAGLHHLELWTADLASAEPAWDWLLTRLGWEARPVDGWDEGRTWHHADGSYVVLEQSPDVVGRAAERCRPGMNHVALTAPDRAALDALRTDAPAHGWTELWPERFPHAGGDEHTAWYGESAEGIEVEVVAVGA